MADIETIIREKHSGDDEQLDFIFSNDDRIIVIAPAGCGKTTAMISKIIRELCIGAIPNSKRVLAMTFSVNAAIRIKDSIKELLPDFVEDSKTILKRIDIANYHNFAMRLLYKYGYVLNNNFSDLNNFKIMDDSTVLSQKILNAKDEYNFQKLESSVLNMDIDQLNNCIDNYWDIMNNKLIDQNIITYNGILVAAIKLLSIDNISSFYSRYYQMIIIDEFQDTNLLGYLLMEKIIVDNKAIFLGDDIQKIYGFLGALDDALGTVVEKYNAKTIYFKNNYRFINNERLKKMDLLIRDYALNYRASSLSSAMLLKTLASDEEETRFICRGVHKIIDTDNNVAILVRAGWQGNIIVQQLEEEGISFFNALFSETDIEYLKFYDIALQEFHRHVSGKAVQSALCNCLCAIKKREGEIYSDVTKKYVFDSLFKLLQELFEVSRTWDGTSKERYINIDFSLSNKGLKHMMEYLDEKVVLTTIHSSKGLEWDYVIIPQMNAGTFPLWKHVCKYCQDAHGCNTGYDYCLNKFVSDLKRKIKEELSAYYVALTRARKDVFLTVNTGLNPWNHYKKTSCLVNLPGLVHRDYDWDDYFA